MEELIKQVKAIAQGMAIAITLQERTNSLYAAVFATNDSIQFFDNKITVYCEGRKRTNDKLLENRKLLDTIANFRKVTVILHYHNKFVFKSKNVPPAISCHD